MSITWYKLKIKKQLSEYECYIRFKFDHQIQSIKIKSFIYLIDDEGNISLSDKKNKFGYDPRILGSLTVEKNFLKNKRKKNLYFDVMKYQGNFNICNLSLIDDYFKNGKALIYQYRDMIYLMDNKKYKIQMGPKKFTIILDVNNYGYIRLNLYSKLEEVERQELIFLHQNEDALCHRYLSNKSENLKNKKDNTDEIEIIEEDENENFARGNPQYNSKNKLNLEEEKDTKEGEENLDEDNLNNTLNTYEVNSDESSVYDSIFFKEGNDNENDKDNDNDKLNINNNSNNNIILSGKEKEVNNNDKMNYNIVLNDNSHSNLKNKINKSKTNRPFFNSNNYNANYNININSVFNNDNNINLFEKLKKEGNNIISSNYENKNQSFTEYSTKKEASKSKLKKIISEKKYNPFNNILTSSFKINENKNFDSINNNNISKKTIFDSLISNDSEKNILLYSSGFESSKFNLKLLYKSSNDSDNILIFHNKCDYIKNVFVIILTLDNKKFGFFTSKGLSSGKNAIYDDKAFLFKLNKEEIDCFHIKNGEIAFYGLNDYVLNLGGDQLIIRDKFLSNASFCGLKMKNYKTNINYQINSGNKNFIIKELEVYSIIEI